MKPLLLPSHIDLNRFPFREMGQPILTRQGEMRIKKHIESRILKAMSNTQLFED